MNPDQKLNDLQRQINEMRMEMEKFRDPDFVRAWLQQSIEITISSGACDHILGQQYGWARRS